MIERRTRSEVRTRGICFPNQKAKAFISRCSTPNYRFIKVIDVSWLANTACQCVSMRETRLFLYFFLSFFLSWHDSWTRARRASSSGFPFVADVFVINLKQFNLQLMTSYAMTLYLPLFAECLFRKHASLSSILHLFKSIRIILSVWRIFFSIFFLYTYFERNVEIVICICLSRQIALLQFYLRRIHEIEINTAKHLWDS